MAQIGTPNPANTNTFAGSAGANTYATSRDLLLKTFSGEMIKHFDEKFALKDGVRSITLNGGISAQFPAIGRASAASFVPGDEITGQAINTAEKTVTLDDMLVSSVWIHNLDEMLTHFEFRGEYSRQMSSALALTMERKLFQLAVGATRVGDQYNDAQTPGVSTPTGAATGIGAGLVGMNNAVTKHVGAAAGAADLVTAAFEAAAYFDSEDLPMEGRALYVSPSTYYSLINQTDKTIINSDFSAGNGNFGEAVIYKVAGFDIIKTNHLAINGTDNSNTGPDSRTPLNKPTAVTNAAAGLGRDYAIDATDTLGMFMHTSGLGVVKAQDLVTETEYSVAKQGTLLASKMMFGSDVLRPSALYEVRAAADV